MKPTYLIKSILLCIAITISTAITAQTVSTEFADKINSVFDGMDLNRVPHQLLADYAMEFVNLKAYNGKVTDSNYVHKGIYTTAYSTLLMSRTKTGVPGLVHPDTFQDNWQGYRTPYTIALSGLYYKYSRLSERAYVDGKITVSNDKLYDKYIEGVWQDPYEQDEVFMITAPILSYAYKNMNVILPEALWYTNQGEEVGSLAIDFNDGNGFQNMEQGQNIYLKYQEKGSYDWNYRLKLSNGRLLYSHSKIIVGERYAPISRSVMKRLITESCNPSNPDSLAFDQIRFQGTTLFGSSANSATIQISYSGGDFCNDIRQPLIVVEGFESGLLGSENPLGENDIEEFLDESRRFSFDRRREIDDYDIIYVNWNSGGDDMRRNAALLKDIITWVNEVKTTANQNVVLGQSMGGIIARYTLASMEQDPDFVGNSSIRNSIESGVQQNSGSLLPTIGTNTCN